MKPDVVVVGGGVVGLSSAYYAARKGARVLLLEREEVGAGSSRGNAGLLVGSYYRPLPAPGVIRDALGQLTDPEGVFGLRPRLDPHLVWWLLRFARACNQRHYRHAVDTFLRLNAAAIAAHLELAAQADGAYEFEQRGLLYLYLDQGRFEKEQRRLPELEAHGIHARTIGRDELRTLVPTAAFGVVGGIHYPHDARLDPARFLSWLSEQAQRAGVRIRCHTEVFGFRTAGRRVCAVRTTRGEIKAEQVVLAAGAWLRPLGRRLGVRIPVEGGKGISLTFDERPQELTLPLLLADHHIAVTPFSSSLRVTGALELSGLDLSLEPRRVQGIYRAAGHYLALCAELARAEVWRGLRPCTPDGLPIVGRLAAWRNVVVAGGHDTKGMSLGPLTGQLVARLLNGESLKEFENPLRPERF